MGEGWAVRVCARAVVSVHLCGMRRVGEGWAVRVCACAIVSVYLCRMRRVGEGWAVRVRAVRAGGCKFVPVWNASWVREICMLFLTWFDQFTSPGSETRLF